MDLKPGTRIKSYVLERQLGRGASGEVWKAYDETKTVAIKFMNENLMTSTSASKHRERLIREVESLRRLQHPNIPTLYDYDLDFRRPYIAMRFVGGDSYDRLISNGEMLKIPLARRLEMIRDIAFALTAAHDAGIIHRDIKPANLTGIENPYLLDFSISLETDDAEHTQRFVGTTLYMSADGVADRLSDNYSFAVVVYEMLFGKHPIYQLGDSLFNQFIAEMRIQNRQWGFPSKIPHSQLPADLRDADLRKLDAIFERAIGQRETRYADLREFVRDLRFAIMPHEVVVEEARVASTPAIPVPPISQPPAPPAEVKPQSAALPAEAVSPEESNFLEKAFVNLPAIKLEAPEPEPAKPAAAEPNIALEQTSLQHSTVPYDYEAKRRISAEELSPSAQERNASGVWFSPPLGEPETPEPEKEAPSTAGMAGPEDMTMPQIRIPVQKPPSPAEPDPTPSEESSAAPVPMAGPEDMTMPQIRIPAQEPPSPAKPEPPIPAEPKAPAVPLAGAEERTMMEFRIPAPEPPQPKAPAASSATIAEPEDRTMPEIRIPPQAPPQTPSVESAPPPAAPPQHVSLPSVSTFFDDQPPPQHVSLPPASAFFDDQPPSPPPAPAAPPPDSDATIPDLPVARGTPPPAAQGDFTMMEMHSPGNAPPPRQFPPSEENFTLLEAQSPQARPQPQQAQADYTMMEVQRGYNAPTGDNFTLMEMQTPPKEGIPSPMHGDNFTLLEMAAYGSASDQGKQRGGKRHRLLLIVAVIVIVVVIIAAIVVLATSGAVVS